MFGHYFEPTLAKNWFGANIHYCKLPKYWKNNRAIWSHCIERRRCKWATDCVRALSAYDDDDDYNDNGIRKNIDFGRRRKDRLRSCRDVKRRSLNDACQVFCVLSMLISITMQLGTIVCWKLTFWVIKLLLRDFVIFFLNKITSWRCTQSKWGHFALMRHY